MVIVNYCSCFYLLCWNCWWVLSVKAKKMAYKCREEIVGKRFLCVSGLNKPKSNAKIADWGWRSGVIRAASHRDNKNQDLQVNDLFVTPPSFQIHYPDIALCWLCKGVCALIDVIYISLSMSLLTFKEVYWKILLRERVVD